MICVSYHYITGTDAPASPSAVHYTSSPLHYMHYISICSLFTSSPLHALHTLRPAGKLGSSERNTLGITDDWMFIVKIKKQTKNMYIHTVIHL